MTLKNPGCAFFSDPPSAIFTVEDFGTDERLMIESAEQFSRKEILPLSERLEQQEDGLMPGLIRKAGELGFCGVDGAEGYGGLGLGKRLAARILEHLSFDASFSVTLGVTSGIAQAGIAWFGTEAQKQKHLPRIYSGEEIAAYALSEPNSGTDALAAQTRADRRGGKWVLNGTKMWITNAMWADVFVLMAKVKGERFSAFLVERSTPGLSVSREEHKMGLKGSSTARVVLEDAEIPLDSLLHEEGKGHQVAFNALNLGRLKLSAMSLGPARHSLGLAAGYSQERRQFGEPISSYGLIRKKLSEMAARHFAAESAIYRTAAMLDEGFAHWGGAPEGYMRAAEEHSVECSICKVFATETQAFVVDEALQVFGGYGFTEEFPIARQYRDARVSRIYEGTNEINRVFIADRLIRRAEQGRASRKGAADSFVAELAAKAIEKGGEGQIQMAALSDLLIYAYVEQSSRLRAHQVGGLAEEADKLVRNWLKVRSAEAFQLATGEAVLLPPAERVDWDALAIAVFEQKGPFSFRPR